MFLKNRSLDQDKSFQKTVKVRSWFCLPCTQHLTLGMKKTVKKIIFMHLPTIHKYFTICICSNPMGLSLSCLKTSFW